jgi:hypothetical protein
VVKMRDEGVRGLQFSDEEGSFVRPVVGTVTRQHTLPESLRLSKLRRSWMPLIVLLSCQRFHRACLVVITHLVASDTDFAGWRVLLYLGSVLEKQVGSSLDSKVPIVTNPASVTASGSLVRKTLATTQTCFVFQQRVTGRRGKTDCGRTVCAQSDGAETHLPPDLLRKRKLPSCTALALLLCYSVRLENS